MVARAYVPDLGDLIWLGAEAPSAREPRPRGAALVLTPRNYNAKTALALACPVARQNKGYPFEVVLPPGGIVTGVVLADRIRSIDWRARGAEFAARAPEEVVTEALERIRALLRL